MSVVCVCVYVCVCMCVYMCNSEIRESHLTAQSVCILFQEISLDKIFNFLEEINIFDEILSFRSFWVLCVF